MDPVDCELDDGNYCFRIDNLGVCRIERHSYIRTERLRATGYGFLAPSPAPRSMSAVRPVGTCISQTPRGDSGSQVVSPTKLPSRTDTLVSENLTVPILSECWSPILASTNLPAVILSGHVALRQTEIGHLETFSLDGNRVLNVCSSPINVHSFASLE